MARRCLVWLFDSSTFRPFNLSTFQLAAASAAGAGIEPTSRRSERPVLPLNDPASVFFADTHRPRQVRRQGSGGRNRTCDLVVQSHASHTISDDPGTVSARRVPCGNRTRLSSLEGWCLSRSAKGTNLSVVSGPLSVVIGVC